LAAQTLALPAKCQLIGRWRIVGANIWDRDCFDLRGSAVATITENDHGEIGFWGAKLETS
jgi:hypothetical protein